MPTHPINTSNKIAGRIFRWFDGTTPVSRGFLGLLLLVIAGALLAPIWIVQYPPLVDYPNHLASAFVLAHLKDPAFTFSRFYASDWNTYPYLTMDAILVGLERFMSIDLAGRLLLSLSVLAVPAAAWFFIRRANPGQECLAFWALITAHNLYFFLWGFTNLQLSLALCLLVLGVWLRCLERPLIATWCLLLVLTTGLYFTHLMGFGVAGFVMTFYAAFARRRFREILFSWALFIPGTLFFLHSMTHVSSGWRWTFDLSRKGMGLLMATAGISPLIDFLTVTLLAVSLGLAAFNNPGFKWNRPWLGVAVGLFALYLVFPYGYGAGIFADRRLMPFLFVLTLSSFRVGRRGRILAAIAILVFFLRAGEVKRRFIDEQRESAKLAQSFSVIPAGARVVPLVEPGRRLGYFWAYGVIRRGWFSPCLFHDPGVQPFRIKADAYAPCGPDFLSMGSLDWNRIQHESGYVWEYDAPEALPALSAMGRVIFEDGNLRVFRLDPSVADGMQEKIIRGRK